MDINASNSPLALGSLQQGDDDFRGRVSQGTASRGPIADRAPRLRGADAFIRSQREKLLQLRDALINCMAGVARETRADNSEGSPFSTHNADAGSDACDRDFALSLLSQERNALFEIDQALQRIELGIYGTCEMSGQPIPVSRLEAIPFARFTVEWQSEIEKRRRLFHDEQSFPSPFAVADEEEMDKPDQS